MMNIGSWPVMSDHDRFAGAGMRACTRLCVSVYEHSCLFWAIKWKDSESRTGSKPFSVSEVFLSCLRRTFIPKLAA